MPIIISSMNLINNLRISIQVILIVLFSMSVMAQGVSFKKINLAEALFLAKKENKKILIDFYTDWCGPCKWMDKNVFTDDSLAATVAKSFIPVKADGEDKNLDINKQFKISAFPTFLFLNQKGEILYKFVGKRTKEAFTEELLHALNPELQICTFQNKYNAGKRDSAFLFKYGNLLKKQHMPVRKISAEYLEMIGEENWAKTENINFLLSTQKLYDSPYFKYIVNNKSDLEEIVDKKALDKYIFSSMYNATYLISGNTDFKQKKHLIADLKKFLPEEKSKYFISKFKETFAYNQKDKTNIRIKFSKLHYKKYPNANEMNAVAWNLYKKGENKRMLKYGLELVNESISLSKEVSANFLDTKARILFKLERNEKALLTAIEAAELAKAKKLDIYDDLLKLIEEIKTAD